MNASKIQRIEITFEQPVNLPDGFEHTLSCLVGMVCEMYQKENPDQVMWPAEHGCQPKWSGGAIVGFDYTTYVIGCSSREDLYGENPYNPERERLQAEIAAERKARKEKK